MNLLHDLYKQIEETDSTTLLSQEYKMVLRYCPKIMTFSTLKTFDPRHAFIDSRCYGKLNITKWSTCINLCKANLWFKIILYIANCSLLKILRL